MIDPVAKLYAFLAGKTAITAYTSTRIYAETAFPPPSYKPSDGRALCFKVRPGAFGHEGDVLVLSVAFTCWAAAATTQTAEERAWELWRAVLDLVESGGAGGSVRCTWTELTGETLYTEAGWPYVFGAMRVALDNS